MPSKLSSLSYRLFLLLLNRHSLLPSEKCLPGTTCGGILSGFQENAGNISDCSYIDIAQPSGKITRALPFVGCLDRGQQSTGIPRSTIRWSGGYIYWLSGTGAWIWQTDDATGDTTQYVSMPSIYNYTLGLGYVNALGLFMLSTSDLYYSAEGDSPGALNRVLSVAALQLSQSAVLVGDYWNPFFYVVDGSSLYIINVTTPTSPQVVRRSMTNLTNVWDLAVYGTDPSTSQLLAVQDFQLYWLDFNGNSQYIMNIPKGKGLPLSNAISGDTWFVCDDATLYTIDPVTATLLTNDPFDGAALQSPFLFHP